VVSRAVVVGNGEIVGQDGRVAHAPESPTRC
jgi:hypothetical protein